MLTLKTNRQIILIVNNVVRACKDIDKLNKTGYGFIYLASGFIAHYNVNGFKDYYACMNLKADILAFQGNNQYNNFHPGQENYEYYKQKQTIYNLICEKLGASPITKQDDFFGSHLFVCTIPK